jgi:hypothetical protein
VLRPGLAGGCINLWSAYMKDAQEGSGRRRRGKGLLDLEDVSLARGGREVVGTEDLLGGQIEESRSHDFISRVSSSSSLPVWTPQPLQAASRAERSARSIIQSSRSSLHHLIPKKRPRQTPVDTKPTAVDCESIPESVPHQLRKHFLPFADVQQNAFPPPSCGSDSCVYDNGT